MIKKVFGFLFLIQLTAVQLFSQYYSTGQDPASIHWRQIKTNDFHIIYPSDFEYRAKYLANILEMVKEPETRSLSSKVGRIPVVIHSRSSISNGYTVWAPKRIELYPTPPPDNYAEEWLEQLALHEYRHAVQISKMNQGFTKGLYYLLGQQATGGILGLFIPSWFLEGDATCIETALSNSGRGRIPSFAAPLRAQLIEKGIYSYDKATMGSYKTYTPDSYILGYHLVAKSREIWGESFWNLPLDRTAKYPFMVVPFASGIKKQTLLSKTNFYKSILSKFDSIWNAQQKSIIYSGFRLITSHDGKRKYPYRIYNYPLFLNDSLILAEKKSLDETNRFVTTDMKGKETKLFLIGNHQPNSHSAAHNKIVWAEYESDARWENKDFSVIRVFDIEKKKTRNLTRRTRYFSPVISPDGKLVCAVNIDDQQKSRIDILNITDGRVISSIPGLEDGLFLQPEWSPASDKLVLIVLNENGKSIALADPITGSITNQMPPSFHEISKPSFFENYIIFNADYSGIENIYALDTLTRKVLQVTSSKFGSRDPDFNVKDRTMVYSEYNSDGFLIAETVVDTAKWVPMRWVRDQSYPLYKILATQENSNIQDSNIFKKLYKLNSITREPLPGDSIRAKSYSSHKYAKAAHLFNPHSWAPVAFDLSNLTMNPGISVLSQNQLSTTFASAGYEYDMNEMTGKVFANLSYAGWYPVFDIQFDYGQRASLYTDNHTGERVRFTWMETNLATSVNIPLKFNHGKFYRTLKPSIGTTLINVIHNSSTPEKFTKGWIQSLDYFLYASQYLRSNPKDMYPKWGQSVSLNFRNTPFTMNDLGSVAAFQAFLYFPGFFNHHSFWFYGGIQGREESNNQSYRFAGIVRYPRGYDNKYDSELFSLEFNYKFPLIYPDFSIGSIVYLKRFKLNLFFDYAEGYNPGALNVYKSTGAEFTADLHLLRFIFPFELGVRAYYLPDDAVWGFNLLWGINF